jgi:hypothetical protein
MVLAVTPPRFVNSHLCAPAAIVEPSGSVVEPVESVCVPVHPATVSSQVRSLT